jgi:hypothetical protein
MNSPFLKMRWTCQTHLVITANYSTKHSMYHQLFDTIWYLQFSCNSLHYNTSHLCQTIYKSAWKLCLDVSSQSHHQTPLHLRHIPRPSCRTKCFYDCMEVKFNSIPCLFFNICDFKNDEVPPKSMMGCAAWESRTFFHTAVAFRIDRIWAMAKNTYVSSNVSCQLIQGVVRIDSIWAMSKNACVSCKVICQLILRVVCTVITSDLLMCV